MCSHHANAKYGGEVICNLVPGLPKRTAKGCWSPEHPPPLPAPQNLMTPIGLLTEGLGYWGSGFNQYLLSTKKWQVAGRLEPAKVVQKADNQYDEQAAVRMEFFGQANMGQLFIFGWLFCQGCFFRAKVCEFLASIRWHLTSTYVVATLCFFLTFWGLCLRCF